MFKRFPFYLVALLSAVLFIGGAKDEPEDDDIFRLRAESLTADNSAKLAVRGAKTYWVEKERMWVNGGTYEVHVDDPEGDSAWAERPTPKDSYNRKFKDRGYTCVIYPFSANVNPTVYRTKTYTVKVPSGYYYKESGIPSGKKQILEGLPMVAYAGSDKPTSFTFKHITAALTVRVTNDNADGYVEVEKIEVINSQYQLCGNVQVTLSTGDPVIKTEDGSSAIPYQKGSPDTVTLNFKGNSPQITTYHDFQIPILPVGPENSQFTIKVYGKSYTSTPSGWVVRKYGPYVQSTNVGDKHIGRARLGYVPLTLDVAHTDELFEKKDTTITLMDGTVVSGDFYKIKTKEDLKELSEVLDERDNPLRGSPDDPLFHNSNYIVMNDIDMGWDTLVPLHYYNEGGTDRCYFYGNGKTVSRFYAWSVDENEPNCCGFFGRTAGDNITIEKLYIDNAIYQLAHTNKDQKLVPYDGNPCSAVGGIYACVDHDGVVIEGCHVSNVQMGSTGKTQGGGQTDFYAGGIVGVVFSSATIRNCEVGTITVDNSHDADVSKPAVVDQFGAAVARIDVGDGSSSNTYGVIVDVNSKDSTLVPAVIIENFSYNQGATPLRFVAGLRNVRYGGLVGNITRGGRLIMRNCSVIHNAIIEAKPGIEMFVSGLIGCAKIDRKMGLHLRSDCSVTGTIVNNAAGFTDYSSDQYVISKYCSVLERKNNIESYTTLKDNKYIKKMWDEGYPCAITCTNTLTVSGNTTGFRVNDQTF